MYSFSPSIKFNFPHQGYPHPDLGMVVKSPNMQHHIDPVSLRLRHTRGQVGSRIKVSVSGCLIACRMADECDSFAFNEYLGQCFLKKCPSQKTCRRKETTCDALKKKEKFYCGQWQTYYYKERFMNRECSPNQTSNG